MKIKDDAKPYNEGGLGRCFEEGSATKLLAQKDVYNQPGHKFEDAAKRLQLLICVINYVIRRLLYSESQMILKK